MQANIHPGEKASPQIGQNATKPQNMTLEHSDENRDSEDGSGDIDLSTIESSAEPMEDFRESIDGETTAGLEDDPERHKAYGNDSGEEEEPGSNSENENDEVQEMMPDEINENHP
ncbi:uncharacterized protein LOC116609467 isoform X2 [Nematostella vectensis]|nr:uncharacterized protein LOC116609467 isoform X2 [Nematostella vectensis]